MNHKPLQDHIRPSQRHHRTATFCADCPRRLQPHTRLILSALPTPAGQKAKIFLRLTVKLLRRLNSIGNRVFTTFAEELARSPEICDHLSVYYADLLAQKLGKELDGLYHCVLINTIDIINRSYTKWISENPEGGRPEAS